MTRSSSGGRQGWSDRKRGGPGRLTRASLLKETARDAAARNRAERLTAAATRAGRIVKGFRAMPRRKPARREPILLNEVVAAALAVTGYALRSAGIVVETRRDAALPPVLAKALNPAEVRALLERLATPGAGGATTA